MSGPIGHGETFLNTTPVSGVTLCRHCQADDLVAADKFCIHCGYPKGGDEIEQAAFFRKVFIAKQDQEEYLSSIRKARNWLFAVAGLNLIPYLVTKEPIIIFIGLLVSLLFVGLALWTMHKPYPAILTALVLYGALNLLAMIEDPANIMRGLIFKVIIVAVLVNALRAVHRNGRPHEA